MDHLIGVKRFINACLYSSCVLWGEGGGNSTYLGWNYPSRLNPVLQVRIVPCHLEVVPLRSSFLFFQGRLQFCELLSLGFLLSEIKTLNQTKALDNLSKSHQSIGGDKLDVLPV